MVRSEDSLSFIQPPTLTYHQDQTVSRKFNYLPGSGGKKQNHDIACAVVSFKFIDCQNEKDIGENLIVQI